MKSFIVSGKIATINILHSLSSSSSQTSFYLFFLKLFSSLSVLFPQLCVFSSVPCFFLSCKANARVKLAKTGHCPHSSTLIVICVVRLLFVLFYVLFVCKCVLPPGDSPTAVNKYINICLFHRHFFPLLRSSPLTL